MIRDIYLGKISIRLDRKLRALGEAIRQARLRRNMSIEDVMKKAKCSESYVRRVEKGSAATCIGAYVRILEALDLEDNIILLAQDDKLGRIQYIKNLKNKNS